LKKFPTFLQKENLIDKISTILKILFIIFENSNISEKKNKGCVVSHAHIVALPFKFLKKHLKRQRRRRIMKTQIFHHAIK
jgi:hypothetical protein